MGVVIARDRGHDLPIGAHFWPLRLVRGGFREDQNVFVHIFKQKVGRVGIAPEYWTLRAVRSPFPSGPILGPDDLVDHNETHISQQHREVGRERESQKPSIRMLVDVCGYNAELPARHQGSVALLPNWSRRLDEVGIRVELTQIVPARTVVGLVPIRRTCHDETYAI